eukprot:6626501-Lingulodinium_polyedra.AAC.1
MRPKPLPWFLPAGLAPPLPAAGPATANPGSRPPSRPLDLISLAPGPGAGAGNPSGAVTASGAS